MRTGRSALIGLALFYVQATGVAAVVDQRNDAATPTFGFLLPSTLQPVGQEFVPTLPGLDFVELQFNSLSSIAADSALGVHIRGGASDSGTILGTSDLEIFTFIPLGAFGIVHFDFAAPVLLTPGDTYFIEVVHALGPQVAVGGTPNNLYSAGEVWAGGQERPNFDLWFREGLSTLQSVPEPATLALLGLALAGLGFSRRLVMRA